MFSIFYEGLVASATVSVVLFGIFVILAFVLTVALIVHTPKTPRKSKD